MRNDLQRLESCTAGLQHWFWENDLLLNADKSKVCFFSTGQKLSRTPLPSTVTVAGCPITVSDKLKTLRRNARRCSHIRGVCQQRRESMQLPHVGSASHPPLDISWCWYYHGRLYSWYSFRYCNALLYGAIEKSLNKLQIVQNKLARVVCNVTTRQQHTIDLLLDRLHWLPIRSRITFKVATLCYKAYLLHQPSYLLDTLEPYLPCHGLRSAEMDLLTVPRSRTKTAAHRFSSAAPTVWNELPLSIRNSDSIVTFRSNLKRTYSVVTFWSSNPEVLFRAPDSIFNMFIYWNYLVTSLNNNNNNNVSISFFRM